MYEELSKNKGCMTIEPDRVDKIEALVDPMIKRLKHVHCGVESRCRCEVISTTNVAEVQSDYVQNSSGYYFAGFQEPAWCGFQNNLVITRSSP